MYSNYAKLIFFLPPSPLHNSSSPTNRGAGHARCQAEASSRSVVDVVARALRTPHVQTLLALSFCSSSAM